MWETKNLKSLLCGKRQESLSTEPLKPGKPTLSPDVRHVSSLPPRTSWGLRGLISAPEPQPAQDKGGRSAGVPLGSLSLFYNMVICFDNSRAFLYFLLTFCRKQYNQRSLTSDSPRLYSQKQPLFSISYRSFQRWSMKMLVHIKSINS